MKAMILAAGRGERMRPLTDKIPKPLLKVGAASLLEHCLARLRQAGITDCVINLAYLGQHIRDTIGNGSQHGMNVEYSDEDGQALGTAGGIIQALPLLGDAPFVVVNADIWTDFDFATLPDKLNAAAHLVMVDNPPHNPQGDFHLADGMLSVEGNNRLTFSGIGVYQKQLFAPYIAGKRQLLPVLLAAMAANSVSGEHFRGMWRDIGTPERLQEIQNTL